MFLVERTRERKRIAVRAALASRLLLFVVALVPLLPAGVRLTALVALVTLHLSIGSVAGSAWNSWMRDLVPDDVRGSFFGNRHFGNTAVAAAVSLAAGAGVDGFTARWPESAPWGYAVLFAAAAVSGLAGLYFLSVTPEPRMPGTGETPSLPALLERPFRDENFRRLLVFLGSWNFVTNLAAPFLTVYMLTRLGYGMSLVVVALVVSQAANLLVVRSFGRLTDQFSNRAVLGVCAPAFLLGLLAWPLTTLPQPHAGTLAIVLAVHVVLGFATAGLNLATSNIALKLAPGGGATSYLAAVAMVSSLCAGIAPLLGGIAADVLASQELSVVVRWAGAAGERTFETLSLRHRDFVFVLAALLGVYPLHRLGLVVEEGRIEERAVLEALTSEAGRAVRNLSPVAGLRALASFPLEFAGADDEPAARTGSSAPPSPSSRGPAE